MTVKLDKKLIDLLSLDLADSSQIKYFMKAIVPSRSHLFMDPSYFEFLSIHLPSTLDKFNDYSLSDIGLMPFSSLDILSFYSDPKQFSLSLKKVKGKGILYGNVHVKVRQHFINALPQQLRLAILIPKLKHAGILDKQYYGPFDNYPFSGMRYSDIIDIVDIGMGSSVYKIVFKSSVWVVKFREFSSQSFFCELLSKLKLKSYDTFPLVTPNGQWEVMRYLGDSTVGDAIQSGTYNTHQMISSLAKFAAIGDVFGRGDRHFENYILAENTFLPIDISYLFWEDNDDWVMRYIEGGLSEFAYLAEFVDDEDLFLQNTAHFFTTYRDMVASLTTQKSDIFELIQQFFSPSPETDRRLCYVQDRLIESESYSNTQLTRYVESMGVFLRHRVYKQLLAQVADRYPVVLEDSYLKMYYLADQGRLSSFFLMSRFDREYVLGKITQLADKYLILPDSYISNQLELISELKVKMGNLVKDVIPV